MKIYKIASNNSNYLDENGDLFLGDTSVLTPEILEKINTIIVRKGHNMRGGEDCLLAINRFLNNSGKILVELYPRWVETISYVLGLKKATKEVSEHKSKLEQMAVKRLGYTNNPHNAGFILQNGKMINLSAEGRGRDLDHREVSSFLGELVPGKYDRITSSDGLRNFMEHTGAIRISTLGGKFDAQILKKPTSSQIKTIKDCLTFTNGACNIDLESSNLGASFVQESAGANISSIIAKINRYMGQ